MDMWDVVHTINALWLIYYLYSIHIGNLVWVVKP